MIEWVLITFGFLATAFFFVGFLSPGEDGEKKGKFFIQFLLSLGFMVFIIVLKFNLF